MQITHRVLVFATLAFAVSDASAQPLHIIHQSLEARIATAEHVVLGTVAKVSEKVIIAQNKKGPDGLIDHNGKSEYTVVLKIDEVLKGSLKGNVDDLQSIQTLGFDRRYDGWLKEQTALLCFLGPAPKAGKGRTWTTLRLGKPVKSEALFGNVGGPPIYSANFTQLDDEKDILNKARAYAKQSTKVLPTIAMRYPAIVFWKPRGFFSNPWNDLMVPIEPALEVQAKRLLNAPEEVILKGEKLTPTARYQLRFSGINALRHFKSEANAACLRTLLNDPPEKFESNSFERSYIQNYPIAKKAREVLLEWGEKVPPP